MDQLAGLLQKIPDAEREEALQYYNDYFDDAGPENEQKVIEELGTPDRVAENIRRELSEGQSVKKPTAADGAIIEYGKITVDGTSGFRSGSGYGAEAGSGWNSGNGGAAGSGWNSGNGGAAGSGWNSGNGGSVGSGWNSGNGGSAGSGGRPGSPGKSGMSGGMIALIVILAVIALIAFPVLARLVIGLLCAILGILVAWFAMIFAFGVTAIALLLVFFVLLIVGGMCIPVDPLVGIGVMGGGLICGGVGLLFLMLTVAMAGGATPALIKGIGHLFKPGRKGATV